MKKTTQLFFSLLLVTFTLFTSCETPLPAGSDLSNTLSTTGELDTDTGNNSNTGGSSTSDILLTKFITTYEDGSVITTDLTYSGNNLIGFSDDIGDSTVFTYDSNNVLIKIEEFENSISSWITELFFDSNGNLIKMLDAPANSSTFENLYVFNADGTITETSSSGDESLYTYDNYNQVSCEDINGENDSVVTFDTSNNPFKNISNKKNLSLASYFIYDNNELTVLNPNQSPSTYANSTFTYTYNSSDFPISSREVETRIDVPGGQEIVEITETEYFYN